MGVRIVGTMLSLLVVVHAANLEDRSVEAVTSGHCSVEVEAEGDCLSQDQVDDMESAAVSVELLQRAANLKHLKVETPQQLQVTANLSTNKTTLLAGCNEGCPLGSTQVGDFNADVGGCGLTSCGDRYDVESSEACLEKCQLNSQCKSFTWAPVGGDQNHKDSTVCSLYPVDQPTGTWAPFQLMCVPEGASVAASKQLETAISWVGCYVDDDDRDLVPVGPTVKGGYTTVTCGADCKASGFTYFGMQHNGQCFCGNAYGTADQYVKVCDEECSSIAYKSGISVCEGEEGLTPTRYCGAGWRNAIYKLV